MKNLRTYLQFWGRPENDLPPKRFHQIFERYSIGSTQKQKKKYEIVKKTVAKKNNGV